MEDLSQCKVLVVDDSEFNIDVLKRAFEGTYIITASLSGEEALEMVAANPPDLILLDVMMPEMDGYETCTNLKTNPIAKDIPIVFLTALDEVQNRQKGFELGAVDYITKPFDILELQTKVKTHLTLMALQKEIIKLRAGS